MEKDNRQNMHRRRFLEGVVATTLAVPVTIAGMKYRAFLDLFLNPDSKLFERENIRNAVIYLLEEYNIEISINESFGSIFSEEVDVKNLELALRYLIIAISKYPKEIIRKSNLNLKLRKNITRIADFILSMGDIRGSTVGFFDRHSSSLLIDASTSLFYFISIFDHEFFHFIDRDVNGFFMHDKEWTSFHNDFCNCNIYKPGIFGKKDRDLEQILFPNSNYGRTNQVEDRAVIAEYMLNDSFDLRLIESDRFDLAELKRIMNNGESYETISEEEFLEAKKLLKNKMLRIMRTYKSFGWHDLNYKYFADLEKNRWKFYRGDFLDEKGKKIISSLKH